MLSRADKEEALINKYTSRQTKDLAGYIKKVRGLVNSQVNDEYDLIILGKAPKPKKTRYGKKEKFSVSDV